MIIIKSPKQIEGIRASSKLAAQSLIHVSKFIKPGISTEELNTIAHNYIVSHNAIPAPLNYSGFPKSICTSVNNVVCHGIPSTKDILKNGDIINIDITTILNGFYGDTSAMYPVGTISPSAKKLIDKTHESMMLAINSLKPGLMLNDCVGKKIEKFLKPFGFSPIRDLGGHGVGIQFHEDPFVYHFDTNRENVKLKPGMIFTVEPMVNASLNWHVDFDKSDGWTVRTADGALSAQFEHTVLITTTGCEILTQL
ncbi:MAG: type I methionyl aminopeptidase [Candidatus Shapirobacteria bacterium]